MIKVAARRVVTIARPSRRSRRRTWKRCSLRSKTSGRSLTLGVAGMGVTTERLRPFRAHNGMTATARTPVLPEAIPVGALSAEAVRKGDVQEPMRERPGSAVEFAGGLDFHTERDSGRPHRLDERLHPEDGDHPLQIVGENVKAHLP